MAEYFFTVIQQILAMFLMIGVGYLMFKGKMITEIGIRDMSVLLLKIVTPMILISAFQREFDRGLFIEWAIMFGASALTYLVCIVMAELCYRKSGEHAVAEKKLSLVLPNSGFLAFPLMQALAGELGIFLGSTSVIILNILQWTYGSKLLRPEEKINIRKIILNPGIIAVCLGLLLFVSPWKLPGPVFKAVDSIGSLNTPLAMLVLGGMLAQTDIKKCMRQISYYKTAFLKLIATPLIMMVIFMLLPLSENVKLVAFICSVTPTATSVSMMSQLYDSDYRYATGTVIITTIISAITMPVILALGKGFLGY